MDKLSHTILYADDTNIIVLSTGYDLKKKVNLTLKLNSEWFQINQLVWNKNKMFVINFSKAKTLMYTLNITLANQLSYSYRFKFFGNSS